MFCPECWRELAKESLVMHRLTQHGVAKGGLGQEGEDKSVGRRVQYLKYDVPRKGRTYALTSRSL